MHPLTDRFDYYLITEENGKEKCNIKIFSAGTNTFYFPYYFRFGKWKNDNEFILSGTKKEVEMRILLDKCKVEYLNLTPYANPPFFTLLRNDVFEEEKEKARKDWEHSLPPEISGIIRQDIEN